MATGHSRTHARHGRVWLRWAVWLPVAAVVMMHMLTASPHPAGMSVTGPHQMSMSQGAAHSSFSDGQHCAVLGHHCLSPQAPDFPSTDLPVIAVLWFISALTVFVVRWIPAIGRFGRAPPWSVRTHLQLSVIRC
ncbi:MAG: hypothetical protein QM673_12390 [Gordonia sp. (in: high G+C Gram-positive bacteria)]